MRGGTVCSVGTVFCCAKVDKTCYDNWTLTGNATHQSLTGRDTISAFPGGPEASVTCQLVRSLEKVIPTLVPAPVPVTGGVHTRDLLTHSHSLITVVYSRLTRYCPRPVIYCMT